MPSSLDMEKAELIEKYEGLFDRLPENPTLEELHDALVPRMGQADSLAGEIVRAMMRILWRDYNDGDVFYYDYGRETAGPSAAFIYEYVPESRHRLAAIAYSALTDKAYTAAIQKVSDTVVKYILEHKDLVFEPTPKKNSRKHSKNFFDKYIAY